MSEESAGLAKGLNINHKVFWPPFSLILFATLYSYLDNEGMVNLLEAGHDRVATSFGWAYALMPFLFVVCAILLCFSKIGDIRFGGKDAVPEFKTWNWFAMSLCAGIGIGIVFWGVAEPVTHLGAPPETLGIEPNSPEAAVFALSSSFLHWTITPYAIYLACALPIALAVYNYGRPFRVSSGFYFILGDKADGWIGNVVDGLCIFAQAIGLSMALGFGLMQISDGLESIYGIPSGRLAWTVIAILTVAAIVVSSYSGVKKGIRFLSDQNAKLFIGLMLFILLTGPTTYILGLGVDSLGSFLSNFPQKSLWTGTVSGEQWPRWWTLFYMGGWFVFAPLIGLFLARLALGRTIRQFILVNLLAPAGFGMIWFIVFGGAGINMQLTETFDIAVVLKAQGLESAVFVFLKQFPLSNLLLIVFLITILISFITMANSMTTVLSAMSYKGLDPKDPEAPLAMKVVWGTLIGASALFVISTAGIDGIKMLSVSCGLPLLVFITILYISFLTATQKETAKKLD